MKPDRRPSPMPLSHDHAHAYRDRSDSLSPPPPPPPPPYPPPGPGYAPPAFDNAATRFVPPVVPRTSTPIILAVKDHRHQLPQQNHRLWFRMNRNARLGKLMDAYSEHTGTSGLRFVWRGEGVRRDDTAEELGLRDQDTITTAPKARDGR